MGTAEKFPPTDRPSCGTQTGWAKHQRMNELQCPKCTTYQTQKVRVWRIRRGEVKTANIPLSVIKRMLSGDSCEPLRQYLPEFMIRAIQEKEFD